MAATKGDKKAGQRSPVRLLLTQILIMLLLSVCIVALALALLDLYTLHGKVTVVPDIVGKSMADAEKMLKKQHLTYEIVDSIYTEDALPGSIQDVQPKAGSKVKPNRTLFIVVNSNERPQVVIPNLSDLSMRQAEAILQGLGFTRISVRYVPGEYDNLTQGVSTTSGTMLNPGQRVDISTALTLVVSTNDVALRSHTETIGSKPDSLATTTDFPEIKEDSLTTKPKEKLKEDEAWW